MNHSVGRLDVGCGDFGRAIVQRRSVDRETGALDTSRIRQEAYPLLGLIFLFAGLALVPFLFVLLFFGNSGLGFVFTLLTQLVLAVGAGIVLMYIIARAIQLADTDATPEETDETMG